MGEREGPTFIHKILAFWKWFARRDELPKTATDPERPHRDRSVLGWLMAKETLPQEPLARSRPQRGKSWLFPVGSLPNPPERDATAAPSFLTWLFRPERLPTAPLDPASKEAS